MTTGTLTPELQAFADTVVERKLKNGLTVLMIPREGVATVHFAMAFGVGAVDEPDGRTGIAHLYEHMAFKGTEVVGTKGWRKERPLLRKLDALDAAMMAERARGLAADTGRIDRLKRSFDKIEARAEKLVEPNEFDRVYARSGGQWLNAFTSQDMTCYIIALPSNRVRLWTAMEGARVRCPVLRQFYRERNVVIEELRIGRDNPHWRLYEELEVLAFTAHPYRVPVVGWLSDLQRMTRADLEGFFRSRYRPDRAVIAAVGAIGKDTFRLIEREFSGWKVPGEPPRPVVTVEPEQNGERRAAVHMQANPALAIGWPIPTWGHADKAALDALSSILGNGQSSRLHTGLVKKRRVAVSAAAFTEFPGERYPNLLTAMAWPLAPHTPAECEAAVYEEIEAVIRDGVTPREVAKVANLLEAQRFQQLQDNTFMAAELAGAQATLGDWRTRLRWVGDLRKLTPDDVLRVARAYLMPRRRSVVTLLPTESPGQPGLGVPASAGTPGPGPVLPEHPDA